jgi:hypothetical protein
VSPVPSSREPSEARAFLRYPPTPLLLISAQTVSHLSIAAASSLAFPLFLSSSALHYLPALHCGGMIPCETKICTTERVLATGGSGGKWCRGCSWLPSLLCLSHVILVMLINSHIFFFFFACFFLSVFFFFLLFFVVVFCCCFLLLFFVFVFCFCFFVVVVVVAFLRVFLCFFVSPTPLTLFTTYYPLLTTHSRSRFFLLLSSVSFIR